MHDFEETVQTEVGPLKVVTGSSMADTLKRYPNHDPGVGYFMRRHQDRLFPFFDVGANCGYFTVLASQLGGPVIAIEADEKNVAVLRDNAPNAKIYPVACAANDGIINMGTMPCGRSAKARENIVQMEARSIRSIADELGIEPAFIKLDIEGGETEALKGIHSPEAILEIEFSWRDHGRHFDQWVALRPPGQYRWDFLLSQFEHYDRVEKITLDGRDYFLASANDEKTLLEIIEALKVSTTERGSRKWELCIWR